MEKSRCVAAGRITKDERTIRYANMLDDLFAVPVEGSLVEEVKTIIDVAQRKPLMSEAVAS